MLRLSKIQAMAALLVGVVLSLSDPLSTDETARATFEFGVQIGIVEQGAKNGDSTAELIDHLERARNIAPKLNSSLPEEIDLLIEEVRNAADSRNVYPAILEFRKKTAELIAGSQPPTHSRDAAASWTGTWETSWGKMTLLLDADGRISGVYGDRQHPITGVVDPDHPHILEGTWRHTRSSTSGRFQFILVEPKQFEGAWTNGEEDPAVVDINWRGTR